MSTYRLDDSTVGVTVTGHHDNMAVQKCYTLFRNLGLTRENSRAVVASLLLAGARGVIDHRQVGS